MNGNNYLLDTNTILYILKGDRQLAELLYHQLLTISVITEIELLGYKMISSSEEAAIREFLNEFRIININNEIKQKCIDLRKRYDLKLPDCIVAATAISLDLPLVTSDKQFRKIKELELLYKEE